MKIDGSQLVAACLLVAWTAGCSSVQQQFRQAVEDIKADISVLDSGDDGLDALGSADAKQIRAARAEMER